jgi:hypothetical protein
LPVASIAQFEGEHDQPEDTLAWLRRFEDTAVSCGWDNAEYLRCFSLYVAKDVRD